MYLIYFRLCWVFVAASTLSLAAVSRGYSLLQCMGFSLWRLFLFGEHELKSVGSAVVVQGLSCLTTCGIFPGQGLNPCPLHWQEDSYPL